MTYPFPSLLFLPFTLHCDEHSPEPLTKIGPSTPDVAGHPPEPVLKISSGEVDRLHFHFPEPRARELRPALPHSAGSYVISCACLTLSLSEVRHDRAEPLRPSVREVEVRTVDRAGADS